MSVTKRWASPVEVADPELFAQAFDARNRVAFTAGLENRLEHAGLMALAWARRRGLIRRPERLAGLLERARRLAAKFGRDTGGMTVRVSGLDAQTRWRALRWTLLAHQGQGPLVPTLPALGLAAIEAEMAPYAMRTHIETLPCAPRVNLALSSFSRAARPVVISC